MDKRSLRIIDQSQLATESKRTCKQWGLGLDFSIPPQNYNIPENSAKSYRNTRTTIPEHFIPFERVIMTFYDVLIISDLRSQFLDFSNTDIRIKTQIAPIVLKPTKYNQKAWETHVKLFLTLAKGLVMVIWWLKTFSEYFLRDSKSSRLDFANTWVFNVKSPKLLKSLKITHKHIKTAGNT